MWVTRSKPMVQQFIQDNAFDPVSTLTPVLPHYNIWHSQCHCQSLNAHCAGAWLDIRSKFIIQGKTLILYSNLSPIPTCIELRINLNCHIMCIFICTVYVFSCNMSEYVRAYTYSYVYI